MSEERVKNLEVRMAFLERTLEDLDGAVRDLGSQVMVVQRELTRLRASVTSAKDGTEPPRKLEDDVPPHY